MKKILIIGAGFLQDFVIRKAVSLGYETLTVDADSNAVGFKHAHKSAVIDIIDEKACLEYAQKENIDGVMTAATEYGVLSASYVAEHMGLPGLNYRSACLIKNKYLVRKCLFDNHVDDSGQMFEIRSDTDLEAMAHRISYPVMVKPCDGSGSRGTSRANDPSHFIHACRYALDNSISTRALIEPFIRGKEYGAESIVVNGKITILAIMKKWMTEPPYYAELGHALPSGLSPEVESRVSECIRKAIHALGVNHGAVNMDLIISEEGKVYIVDVGARMGGNLIGSHIVPYASGVDYMGALIRLAVGEPVDIIPGKRMPVATKLITFGKGTISRLPDTKELENRYNVEIYHHMTEGMHVNEYHTNIDGCGYIVAKGADVESAINRAEHALEEIRNESFEADYGQ